MRLAPLGTPVRVDYIPSEHAGSARCAAVTYVQRVPLSELSHAHGTAVLWLFGRCIRFRLLFERTWAPTSFCSSRSCGHIHARSRIEPDDVHLVPAQQRPVGSHAVAPAT
jgi:hypothetical protein